MARRSRARVAAVAATRDRCPRCGAPRAGGQRYCLECGLALPARDGTLARLRATWIRRLGWYPGDFVWVALAAFAVAAAGAAAAIELGSERGPHGRRTVVATIPAPVAPTPAAEPNGKTRWPPGQAGWTVVLESVPAPADARVADARAASAAGAGLPQVGVLDSSGFPSLLPGYYVVFSGVYASAGDATTALRSVEARGYGGAYTGRIVP